MGSSYTHLQTMISTSVNEFSYHINLSGIHQRIYLKFIQWRVITGQYSYINIFESTIPCAPTNFQCRDDSGIHKFDRAMSNVSVGLSHDLMVYRLISNVSVRRKRSGYANYT